MHRVREPVAGPYVNDDDAPPSSRAPHWPSPLDVTRWGFLAAWVDGARVGGAAAARQLRVEIQGVILPACRFYARRGCGLGAVYRFAHPGLPEEAQLLWYRDLTAGASAA